MITASEAKALANRYDDTIGIIDDLSDQIETVAKRGTRTHAMTLVRKISPENLDYIQMKFTEAGFECYTVFDPIRRETRIEVRWA